MNKGFSVYHNYWEAIQHFDEETQKNICFALIKYGITGELPEDSISKAMIMAWKIALDRSIENFNLGEIRGSYGGNNTKIDSKKLEELIVKGYKAREIAESLGVSVDAVYKRDEWKNRKYLKEIGNLNY